MPKNTLLTGSGTYEYPTMNTAAYDTKWLDLTHWKLRWKSVVRQHNGQQVGNSHSIKCVEIYSENTTVILSGIIHCINYMFRPLLGHHQVVLSLQRLLYYIVSIFNGRRDLVHSGQIYEFNQQNGTNICYLYTIYHIPFILFDASFNTGALCARGHLLVTVALVYINNNTW
jgi:hypothetical protein